MKGIYILLIELNNDIQRRIGSLGKVYFSKGIYAYVGSAQNSLEKRIARHAAKRKKKFWHIDYLLSSASARILKVFYKEAGKEEECKMAKKLSEKGRAISGFGASDCNCESHLFQIRHEKDVLDLGMKEMKGGAIFKNN
ncbi:GIY-YIG nuclease family protein [Candidatus Woesearchaeota archaeon]|nr:MAG: GIY-YIG nuclease family protein [Candidatus Woesearchaeota archaeon]